MRRSLLSPAVLILPLAAPVMADDAPPPRLALTLGVTASHASNPDLAVTGGASETTLGLSLGLSSALVSRDQSLRLSLDGRLEEDGLAEPAARITYERQGAWAKLSFDLTTRESPVDLSEPVLDGTGATVGLLSATGDVRQSAARLAVETDAKAPYGASLALSFSDTDYSPTSDPSLADAQGRSLRLGVFAPALGGRLGFDIAANASRQEDAAGTARDSATQSLSWTREMGALTLVTRLGYSESETRKSGAVTAESRGATGQVALRMTQAAGTAGVVLDFGRDVGGARQGLRLTRSLDLPSGALAAELGYEGRPGGAGAAVGRLSYEADQPLGKLSFALDRKIALDSDDADSVQTSASLGWQRQLTAAASLSLGWRLSSIGALGTAPVDEVTRQSLTASFRQEVGRDWGLQAGVTLTQLDEEASGRAEDARVFVTFGRSLVLWP